MYHERTPVSRIQQFSLTRSSENKSPPPTFQYGDEDLHLPLGSPGSSTVVDLVIVFFSRTLVSFGVSSHLGSLDPRFVSSCPI